MKRQFINFILLVSVLCFLAALVSCAGTKSRRDVLFETLPKRVKIVPPSPDLPKNIQAFSGIWEGVIGGGEQYMLVVVEVTTENSARIIWASGGSYSYGPWYRAFSADIISGEKARLQFTIPDAFGEYRWKFEMQDDLQMVKAVITNSFFQTYGKMEMKRAK